MLNLNRLVFGGNGEAELVDRLKSAGVVVVSVAGTHVTEPEKPAPGHWVGTGAAVTRNLLGAGEDRAATQWYAITVRGGIWLNCGYLHFH